MFQEDLWLCYCECLSRQRYSSFITEPNVFVLTYVAEYLYTSNKVFIALFC